MMKVYRKPSVSQQGHVLTGERKVFDAVQWDGSFTDDIHSGPSDASDEALGWIETKEDHGVFLKPGDWIMTAEDGCRELCAAADFERRFEAAE